MSWTATGGGDHGGADWTIDSNTTISGIHTNINIFKVDSGITATLLKMNYDDADNTDDTDYHVKIYAEEIDIQGTITGAGKGFYGGGDYSAEAGTSYWHTDGYGPGKGNGGHSGDAGAGASYGGNGGSSHEETSYDNPYGLNYTPTARCGSGGGKGDNDDGGKGGGCCLLFADTIGISGIITCIGGNGEPDAGGYDGGGGGSGGGIVIFGGSVNVSGSVLANGGNGGYGYARSGGGGSGGRIKIFSHNLDISGATITATGGTGWEAGADGTLVYADLGTCNGTHDFGQTFTTLENLPMHVTNFVLYAWEVNTSGDFTLKVWDTPSKGSELATSTATISGTGDNTFTLTSAVTLVANTEYYIEITSDSTGDVVFAIDCYSTVLESLYHTSASYEIIGFDAYLKVGTDYAHIIDPVVYNTANSTVELQIANEMLIGAVITIGSNDTGTFVYSDDITTTKYLGDSTDSGTTYDDANDKLNIADGGYVYYIIDTKYPVTGIPILTAQIDITAGTPTIQISSDASTWYDIDTAIVDDVSTEYELDNATSLSLKGLTSFYFRIDCGGTGTVTCSIKSFQLDANIVTIDAENPVINTGAANTFRCDQDAASGMNCIVELKYRDRKWAA